MTRSVGQHHGDLRRALLDAALELVAETTPDQLTLRAVARRAGVSAAAPYHHFADKDELLAEVAREGFAALAAAQQAAPSTDPTPSPDGDPAPSPDGGAARRLERLAAEYVRFALAHPTHYTVMFRTPPSTLTGPGSAALRDTALGTFRRLVEAVEAANPALSPAQAVRRALAAWSLAHGAVDVSRWGRALEPTADLADLVADVARQVRRLAQERP